MILQQEPPWYFPRACRSCHVRDNITDFNDLYKFKLDRASFHFHIASCNLSSSKARLFHVKWHKRKINVEAILFRKFYLVISEAGTFSYVKTSYTASDLRKTEFLTMLWDCGGREVETILSKPKLNQQLSSTEFEVRLHSYIEIHPPHTNSSCCCCAAQLAGGRQTVQPYSHS